MMMISAVFSMLIASGCATSPELPEYDLTVESDSDLGEDPVPDCPWPEIVEKVVDGEKLGTITRAEALNLLICVDAFETNVTIAARNKDAAEAMVIAHNAAVEYGRKLHELASFELSEIDHRRQMAEIESLAMKAILAIAVVASLL
jgi:hypothetical protein